MLTLVSIFRMEDRMKNKFLIIAILAMTGQIQGKTINISRDNPYAFSLVSSIEKRPLSVHRQNEDYLKISCKKVDAFKENQFLHSCVIRPKSGSPEGTFALFKKTPEGDLKSLFHVSIEI